MKNHLFTFLDSLEKIGIEDETLYDTFVKDTVLNVVLTYSNSGKAEIPDDFGLQTREDSKLLHQALVGLLKSFESNNFRITLEEAIKEVVNSSDIESARAIQIDTIFGDYFTTTESNQKHLYKPLRDFFYSDKCSLMFMTLPPIVFLSTAYVFLPQMFGNTLLLIISIILAFVSTLGGSVLYDFLNKKIQKYEGVPGANSI